MPEVAAGMYLIEALFKVGPTGREAPLEYAQIESWARVQGIELRPWQYDVLVNLSRDYLAESYGARDRNAPAPWEPARRMWAWVKNQRAERSLDGLEKTLDKQQKKEKQKNGNRQRR
jgi:hypothetical protein